MVELSQGCLRCGVSCLRCGASCPLIWGELSSEGGASCLGARFLWGELSWGELSLGRVVCHSAISITQNSHGYSKIWEKMVYHINFRPRTKQHPSMLTDSILHQSQRQQSFRNRFQIVILIYF